MKGLKIRDLFTPILNSKKIFESLKRDHPALQAKLAIFSFAAHTEIDFTSPWQLLRDTPAIFVPTKFRDELLLLFDVHEKLKSRNDFIKSMFVSTLITTMAGRIDLILNQIEVTDSASIDLQFINLDYVLIADLQRDARVDKTLTPRTKASIRVSLGTIRTLSEIKP